MTDGSYLENEKDFLKLQLCLKHKREASDYLDAEQFHEADASYWASYTLKANILPQTSIELLTPINGLIKCATQLGKKHAQDGWESKARFILKHVLGDQYSQTATYSQLIERLMAHLRDQKSL